MSSHVDWGAEEESFPTHAVNEFEFHASSSNSEGISDVLTCRLDPQVARLVDELIMECKRVNIPIRTRSDFMRLAISRCIPDLMKHVGNIDSGLEHDLLMIHTSMKASRDSQRAEEVRQATQSLITGVAVMVNSGDTARAKMQIIEYLKPVLGMASSNEFLMALHIKLLFSSKAFQSYLAKIQESDIELGNIIGNAQKAFERLTHNGNNPS